METAVHLTVRVPVHISKKLKEIAEKTGKTKSVYIVEALKIYLSHYQLKEKVK